jgi:formylglycine-generating enzyme required for sulfatase activity
MAAPNFDASDGFERAAPVGSFPSGRSSSGLDDAFGNAWEFTADLRVEALEQLVHDGEKDGALQNVRAPGPGLRVAVRGGSFYFDLRPNPGAEWGAFTPEIRRKSAGFRCSKKTGG